jgi:hypothetical protein
MSENFLKKLHAQYTKNVCGEYWFKEFPRRRSVEVCLDVLDTQTHTHTLSLSLSHYHFRNTMGLFHSTRSIYIYNKTWTACQPKLILLIRMLYCINGTLPYHLSSTSAVYRMFARGVRCDVILQYIHEVQQCRRKGRWIWGRYFS